MARNPGPGQCVHCLEFCRERNWDHVIPVSWYPKSTPEDQEKWKIPSCLKCNSDYGTLESDLLLRLSLCLDPRDILAAGVSESALRSIQPEHAKSERDRRARTAKRNRILSQTMPVSAELEGALPGFGFQNGVKSGTGILAPVESLERFGDKIVRGATFIDNGRLIEDPFKVEICFVAQGTPAEAHLEEFFSKHTTQSDWGPGVVLERGYIPDCGRQGIHRFLIWGRFRGYGFVQGPNDEQE